MTPSFRDRVRFFHTHAGSVVGECMLTAWRLAKAEERAGLEGLTFHVLDEQEPWDGECEAPKHNLCCYVVRETDRFEPGPWLASLGMVGVESMRDPYLRVVAAELFLEVLSHADAHCSCQRRHGS